MGYRKLAMVVLILFAFPLCAGAALGYEMSENRIAAIPTVIIDHDNSEFSRMLVSYINASDIFSVTRYADTDGEIEDMIFKGEAHVGVIIPDGLGKELQSGSAVQVMAVYDGSYMTVAASAKAALSEIFLTAKTGYMTQVYESGGAPSAEALRMAQPFEAVYRVLYNPARNYRNFFLPGLIAAIIQVGIVIVGLERAKEENAGLKRSLVKIIETGLIGSLSIALNIAVQCCFFGMPFKGGVSAFIILTLQLSLCMAAFGYLFGKLIADKILATQLACIFVLPATILGGYTFPLMAMPAFFRGLRLLIPFSYYGEDLRNLSLKGLDVSHVSNDIMYFLIFLAAELIVLCLITAKSAGSRGYVNG